jgi:DNA polymerase-3 subunit epsilon
MDQVQLEVLRAEAVAADRSFSKGRLRSGRVPDEAET